MGKIFSPGKLMLTSEYFVLDGAPALAVPTRPGQELFFEEIQDGRSLVFWEALHQGKSWLRAVIDYREWAIVEANLPDAAQFILNTLRNVAILSPGKFKLDSTYYLQTNLQFPPDFGLGSSSTLMNNLAEWAQIDPYTLNDLSLGGSGYDIAVAKEKSAVVFQIKNQERTVEKVTFNPEFKDELIFVHLNQKQDSREGIKMYRAKEKPTVLIEKFSEITQKVLQTHSLEEFSELMMLHEGLVSEFLGIPTAKELLFQDYPFFIKSLGAWGGDFVMTRKSEDYKDYFREKKFKTVLNWDELIYT